MRTIDPNTYEPVGYRVLIRDMNVEEKTEGGIILPDQSKTADEHAQQFGEVVQAGPLAFTLDRPNGNLINIPECPRVGDVVNYVKYAGGTYYHDDEGKRYRIINDEDILGVTERAARKESEAA